MEWDGQAHEVVAAEKLSSEFPQVQGIRTKQRQTPYAQPRYPACALSEQINELSTVIIA